jgi:sugar phosphate isomerase/epimerase
MNSINRRQFLHATALSTAGLCLPQAGCASPPSNPDRKPVAFNTANLVARFTNYRFELKHWGEQHQKTVAEALAKVGGGNDWLGLCVDTGWFGTQAADVPEQIRAAAKFVRHTHIKDVKTAGAHETCLLGEGVVNVAGCLAALHDVGYTGWYSWEDEPEDRNPLDSASRNREWIEARLRG